MVSEWATRRRRADKASDQELQRIPAARTIAKLMTTKRDHLTRSETVTVAAIEKGVPILADARVLVDRFQTMIRQKTETELEAWIIESKRSLIASFANGIARDKAAVHAAITLPWSNGQVEAQITKLKLVKTVRHLKVNRRVTSRSSPPCRLTADPQRSGCTGYGLGESPPHTRGSWPSLLPIGPVK